MPQPLFKPFRALGYITEDVPFVVHRRGKEAYVCVSVGRAWQVYNCAKLTLIMVGPQVGVLRDCHESLMHASPTCPCVM